MKLYLSISLTLVFISIANLAYAYEPLTPEFKANYVPELSKTEAGLWMKMSDYEEQLKNSPIRINNPQLNKYLKDVLCKLSPEYCNDVRMYVVRNPLFNASMGPNGMMQIHTGFLIRVRNEAQLASVLGHEMGHYLKRHSIKRMKDQNAKGSFFAFFTLGIMGAVATGNMHGDVGRSTLDLTNLVLTGSIFAHSRDHEREADKYGIQLLQNAKLNINEAKTIWINLTKEKEAAADDNINAGSYFYATHPDPGERIVNLEKHAADIEKTEQISSVNNSEIYWKNVSPVLEIAYQDELNLRQFDQSEYLYKNLLKDGVSPGLTNFYLGELYRLREDENEEHLIKSHYEEALRHPNHPAEVHRALGLIEYKAHNFSIANEHFSNYLVKKPNAHDKEMIEFYMNTGA